VADLVGFFLWPQLFVGMENTAGTGLGNSVSGQLFLFMAISNCLAKVTGLDLS